MPMLAHRAYGVDVNGDMDIWQNNWTNETYQYFAVDKMRFAKVRDKNGKLVADKHTSSIMTILPLRTSHLKHTNMSLMVNPLSSG